MLIWECNAALCVYPLVLGPVLPIIFFFIIDRTNFIINLARAFKVSHAPHVTRIVPSVTRKA